MATMKQIATSPLLLAGVIIGLLYITLFSLAYFKKAYDRCLQFGMTKDELKSVIKSSAIFSIVPSLSIVIGLFTLIAVLGTTWSWWRLSVIGSLSYETMISSSIASIMNYSSAADMMANASGQEFGVIMILMSIGMLAGFFILIPLGRKLCTSVDQTSNDVNDTSKDWNSVLSGTFMLTMLAVYIPIILIGDTIQALVMITGLIIAIALGVLAAKPKLRWLNEFIMAFSMIGGMVSALLWTKIF